MEKKPIMNLSTERNISYSEDKLKEQLTKLGLLEQFGEHNVARLCAGLPTTMIEHVPFEGRLYDGKFNLQVDKDGNYNLHFNKKKVEIEVPEEILGKKISKKDKEHLLNGDTLGPFSHAQSKTNFYLCIDKELNAVSVKTDKQLGIPKEMLGHTFSTEEKNLLANNKAVGPRVFCVDGQYFIGTFTLHQNDSENHHMSMMIDKEISKAQAEILKGQLKDNVQADYSKALSLNDKYTDKNAGLFIPIAPTDEYKASITTPNILMPKQEPKRSFVVDIKGVVFQYNETFGYQTITYNKEHGIVPRVFGYNLSKEDMKLLLSGQPLVNRPFKLKNNQLFNGHIYLNKIDNKYQIVVEPTKDKELVPIQQQFTELDRKVMDLVDKKDFKELNQIIKAGYRPSEDIENLIFKNPRIPLQEKQEIATVFNIDHKNLNILHQDETIPMNQKKGVPGSNKVPTPQEITKEKSKNNNKEKLLNTTKGLFHDM